MSRPLDVPPDAGRVLPIPKNPPSKEDWEIFRPLITELYGTGKTTARTIVGIVQGYGFHVTEKMLRDRFRLWEINNKNKRPNVARGVRRVRSVQTADHGDLAPASNDGADDNRSAESVALRDTAPGDGDDGALTLSGTATDTVQPGPRAEQILRDVKFLTTLIDRYSAIALPFGGGDEKPYRKFFIVSSVIRDFGGDLLCLATMQPVEWHRKLTEAGNKAICFLKDQQRSSLDLQTMVTAPSNCEYMMELSARVMLYKLFAHAAHETLSPSHLVTQMGSDYRFQDVLRDLGVPLTFDAMQNQVVNDSVRALARFIMSQTSFGRDVPRQDGNDGPLQFLISDAQCRANILCILAREYTSKGSLELANGLLRKVWILLCKDGRELEDIAMRVLEDRACLYGFMGHLVACEEVVSRLERNWKRSKLHRHLGTSDVQELRWKIPRMIPTPTLRSCKGCDEAIVRGDMYFHCAFCDDSDFDLCQQCVDQDGDCPSLSHEHALDLRINPTMREIQKWRSPSE